MVPSLPAVPSSITVPRPPTLGAALKGWNWVGGVFTGHQQQCLHRLLKDQKSLPAREVGLG